MNRRIVWVPVLLAAVTVGSIYAWATPEQRSMVYAGRVERDGVAVSGTHSLVFRFYSQDTGGTQIGDPVFVPNVAFSEGSFSVPVPLSDAVLNADPVFLNATYGDSADPMVGTTTQLQGRQRIFPVPYAIRGRGEQGFVATAPLVLRGNTDNVASIDANGNATVAALNAAGMSTLNTVNITGGAVVRGLTVNGGATMNNGLAVAGDLNVPGRLLLINNDNPTICTGGMGQACNCPAGTRAITAGVICSAGYRLVASVPTPSRLGWSGWCDNPGPPFGNAAQIILFCGRLF